MHSKNKKCVSLTTVCANQKIECKSKQTCAWISPQTLDDIIETKVEMSGGYHKVNFYVTEDSGLFCFGLQKIYYIFSQVYL